MPPGHRLGVQRGGRLPGEPGRERAAPDGAGRPGQLDDCAAGGGARCDVRQRSRRAPGTAARLPGAHTGGGSSSSSSSSSSSRSSCSSGGGGERRRGGGRRLGHRAGVGRCCRRRRGGCPPPPSPSDECGHRRWRFRSDEARLPRRRAAAAGRPARRRHVRRGARRGGRLPQALPLRQVPRRQGRAAPRGAVGAQRGWVLHAVLPDLHVRRAAARRRGGLRARPVRPPARD